LLLFAPCHERTTIRTCPAVVNTLLFLFGIDECITVLGCVQDIRPHHHYIKRPLKPTSRTQFKTVIHSGTPRPTHFLSSRGSRFVYLHAQHCPVSNKRLHPTMATTTAATSNATHSAHKTTRAALEVTRSFGPPNNPRLSSIISTSIIHRTEAHILNKVQESRWIAMLRNPPIPFVAR
jgi:hypothetical protein